MQGDTLTDDLRQDIVDPHQFTKFHLTPNLKINPGVG